MGYARVQPGPFNIDAALRELVNPRVGGVAFYVGIVRGQEGERRVTELQYEAHEEMASHVLERLRRDTVERFKLVDAIVIHRVGRFHPGEAVLLVALAAAHRAEAFHAITHFMDALKNEIPIWKREEGSDGPTWILGSTNERVRA